MIWIACAVVLLVGVLGMLGMTRIAAFLRPVPDPGTRRCPHCGHEFEGERRYCMACGGQIWDDVLSED